MPTEKKLTGYPSIDKPWLKYYTEEAINAKTPKCSIYQNIYDSNAEHLSDVALMFFGKKITYKQLFTEVDRAAKAFTTNSVHCGENVVLCMPAIPETIYAILALNKIGANAVMLNPLFTEEQLIARISETDAKLMVVVNELYGRVKNVIPKTTIKNVVSCAAVNSLGVIVKLLKKAKTIPCTTAWNNFLKQGKGINLIVPEYEPIRPAIMVYSSGTTGASKGIQLTNDSINSTITEGVQIGFEWQRGDRWFSQIPVWFSTGICAQTLVPLKYGITIILEPIYDFEVFYQHIIKYKPNFMITACGLLDHLMTKQPKAEAYKGFKFLCAGGEYVTPSAEKKYNDWLKANDNHYGFFKGYGMCECGGTVTASSPKSNAVGSAGVPTPNVVVSAFDLGTGKECKYGERGEIRVLTPSRMLGYYKNPTATAEYFHEDEHGQVWACTGDMGYITADGSVYVDGRISSSYKNANDETIYLFDIERAVLDIESVRQCKAVVSEINGKKTHVAHLVMIDGADKDTTLNAIKEHCASKLPVNHIPTLAKLYDTALPVAPSGKLDIAKMENDTENITEI
ncbi:MAG: class I adenylate-forming enzyme family protein [Oscillospiraceae bacterium]|nr:class I adenylate-forming enzyme family protein [Oscillospiraceae bacterium]